MQTVVTALLIGRPRPFRGEEMSAIARTPVNGAVWLGPTGFEGDEVANKEAHGGPDKALHHYALDHYPWWRARLGDHPLLDAPGAFGENLSTEGLVETELRIGDRFRLGDALVELSHGRQPCWKLDHRFGVKGRDSVMAAIVASGRCGFYYRVLEPGMVAPGDTMALTECGDERWSVARAFALLVGGGHKAEPAAVRELATLPALAEAWRSRAAKLA